MHHLVMVFVSPHRSCAAAAGRPSLTDSFSIHSLLSKDELGGGSRSLESGP